MRFYDSAEEVNRRLGNGIILYRGEPVLVHQACSIKGKKSKFGVTICSLPTRENSWKISLEDPDLEYRKIPLGFVNLHGRAYRLCRIPARTVHQALSRDNVSVMPLDGGVSRYGFDDIIQDQEGCDTLAGRYPSMEVARRQIESNINQSCAFHRDWAYDKVMGVPALHYRTKPVGLTIDPKKILKLDPELAYLKEALNDIGVSTE